jgi:integrase
MTEHAVTPIRKKENNMQGYVARKGTRWYAVIYHGLDPVTGKEQRSWHAAGDNRDAAVELAARLAAEAIERDDASRGLTFGAYLTERWLPGKQIRLRETTYAGYRRNVHLHILPVLGKIKIRRLTPANIEALYQAKLRPTDGSRPLSRKTVLELHIIIRGALGDAHRQGIVTRNVAAVANAPKLRAIPAVEPHAWTEEQLRLFLRAAAKHRLYPAFRLSACTGMRRSELLGLKWADLDWRQGTVSIQRGLVAIGYELCETRGKTRTSRRLVELDHTTLAGLRAWRDHQHAVQTSIGLEPSEWMFPTDDGGPTHPHTLSQTFERLVARAGLPPSKLHDLRHTHATLLIKNNIPVKVVSERLGHAKTCFTIDTYQAVQPGMQAEAARTIGQLANIGGAIDSGATPAAKLRRPPSTGKTRLADR